MENSADLLVQAIDAALARYPGLKWIELSPRAQAHAIDSEMSRIEEGFIRDIFGISTSLKARHRA
jgi:hypothetical protein